MPMSPPTHSKSKQRKHAKIQDKMRPNAYQRGYDRNWAKARKMELAEEPFCVVCGKPATVRDHKIPHKGDHDLFYDPENRQSMCKRCHDKKTAEERWGND